MYDTCHTKLQNLRGKWLWPLYKFANHLVLINHKFIILRGKGAELQVSVPGPLALETLQVLQWGDLQLRPWKPLSNDKHPTRRTLRMQRYNLQVTTKTDTKTVL